jgi:hypothetical protein
MKTVCPFVAKFASLISWELSCFDRVIFKGHLPFSYASKFAAFVDYRNGQLPLTCFARSGPPRVRHADALPRTTGTAALRRGGGIRFVREQNFGRHITSPPQRPEETTAVR